MLIKSQKTMNKALLIDFSQIATRNSGHGLPEKFDDVRLLDGVREVLHDYGRDKFIPILLMNAPGIEEGIYSIAFVQNILKETLKIIGIHPSDAAFCESNNPANYFAFPNIGMVYTAARRQQLKLKECILICAKRDIKKAKQNGFTGKIVSSEKAFGKKWKKDFEEANRAPPKND